MGFWDSILGIRANPDRTMSNHEACDLIDGTVADYESEVSQAVRDVGLALKLRIAETGERLGYDFDTEFPFNQDYL